MRAEALWNWAGHRMNAEKKEGLGPRDECGSVSNDDIDVPSSVGICLTCQAWR